MEQESRESNVQPMLSARLLYPSSILGMILMGLTVLPMSSCEGRDQDLVPARLALAFAGFEESPPPSLYERVDKFMGSLPLLFLFTWPYWTSIPALVALPIVLGSRRYGTILWRLLTLALSVAIAVFLFASEELPGYVIGVGGTLAVLIWLHSSPSINWIWRRAVGIVVRRVGKNPPRSIHPVHGGFIVTAVISGTALICLVLSRSTLLLGGKLAALTNLAMVIVAVFSARQATMNCNRIPSFEIRDLLVTVLLAALSMWWFFS